MFEALRQKVRERHQRIKELEGQLAALRAEVRAYEDAVGLAEAELERIQAPAIPVEARKRRVSVDWVEVLKPFAAPPYRPFDVDEVASVANTLGIMPSRSAIRGQLASLVQKNRAIRVTEGVFKFTDLGASEISNGGFGNEDVQNEHAADSTGEPAA